MAYREYKTDQQSNINWGETFKMGVKAPLIADRIFETYQDALDYVENDHDTSAVAGIVITVVHDTSYLETGSTEANRNGVYYVGYDLDENGNIRVDGMGIPYLKLLRQTIEQVQADWDETNAQTPSFIRNKPYIPEDYRTINHEIIIGDDANINVHDGYYYPNAVQDYDGNWYGAVVIGDQVWLAENLRTEHLNNGTEIPDGGSTVSDSVAYRYNNTSSNIPVDKRGYLYNYSSAEASGISPSGWHVPTMDDIDALVEYLGKQKRFLLDDDETKTAKSLASTSYWTNSNVDYSVGKNQLLNNTTGFSAFPVGSFYGSVYSGDGGNSDFWSVTSVDEQNAWYMRLSNILPTIETFSSSKSDGRSIRLLCNMDPVKFRAWYVEQYGSMQHHIVSSDYGEYEFEVGQ